MTAKRTNQLKPQARNGKPLMSQLLNDTRKYIEQAEQTDVESLRQFFFTDPERPLVAMGHGGSITLPHTLHSCTEPTADWAVPLLRIRPTHSLTKLCRLPNCCSSVSH